MFFNIHLSLYHIVADILYAGRGACGYDVENIGKNMYVTDFFQKDDTNSDELSST